MSRSLLITNISELTTNDDEFGGRLNDAALAIEDKQVVWVGNARSAPSTDEVFDANKRAVLPGWVDSHTHLIFSGDRTREFEDRMSGLSYSAGGIHSTVDATREASEEELRVNFERLIHEATLGGTTTLETKTGYGLNAETELRSARIASELLDHVTFLGAHVVPRGVTRNEYVTDVSGPMLEAVAPFINAVDVFCEKGAFDEQESRQVLRSARQHGLATRVHGNQLSHGPGVRLAVEHGSLSVDHLNFVAQSDIDRLVDSWSSGSQGTVATILPACDVSTRVPFAPARQLLDAGAVISIASNCNPGSSYTSSMNYCVATAVLQMDLSIEEAVRAATLGGAIALGVSESGWRDRFGVPQAAIGRLSVGARADLQVINAPSATHLAYRPGMPLTAAVWKAGQRLV